MLFIYKKIDITEIEKWYIICDNGIILDKDNREVKYNVDAYGYYRFYIKELKTSYLVHRIILTKFLYNENDIFLQVNHIDMNKKNNSLDNLCWVTSSENVIHARNNHIFNIPSNIRSVLNRETVLNIYKDLLNGIGTVECSNKYNINCDTVRSIKYKRSYVEYTKNLDNINVQCNRGSISNEIKECILEMSKLNYKPSQISKILGIPAQTIVDIRSTYILKDNNIRKFSGGEKLSMENVIDIINEYNKFKDIDTLSTKYKVCSHTIKNILRRKTWTKVTENIFIDY